MDFGNVWTVAGKDFSTLRIKKSIIYALVAFPLGVGLGLPTVIWYVMNHRHVAFASLIPMTYAFSFFSSYWRVRFQ